MALRQHLQIRQGETWERVVIHQDLSGDPVDLTSCKARMRVSAGYEGIYEAFLSSTPSEADGGSIELGAAGEVTLRMTAKESAAVAGNLSELLLVEPQKRADRYVHFLYDIEIEYPDGRVERIREGEFIIQREVTR